MVALEGTGTLSHVSLRHRPEVFHAPMIFSALYVAGASTARVLEGPVPGWKAFGAPDTGNGASGKNYGLPRFSECAFTARFPFATISLADPTMPVTVEVTGWSPFIPGDADASSLPVFGLEYTFRNPTAQVVEAVYSFHAGNFMRVPDAPGACVLPREGGFLLAQPPVEDKPTAEGYFAVALNDPAARVDCAWFRGGWFDALTVLWKTVQEGGAPAHAPHADGDPSQGGSIYLPFRLAPGEEKTVRLQACWYVPHSAHCIGTEPEPQEDNACGCGTGCCGGASLEPYHPWYAARFASIDEVAATWQKDYARLREESARFSACFYDTTLPSEVVEAVAANLTILKSPTCLRQADGRFWGWEGCCDSAGCCNGSCTHVWNYAQALPHLFPMLERSMRETEFFVNQDARGHQTFRTNLPIRPPGHTFYAAADGQLGGIMKVYREWRVSGDSAWMRRLWPRVRQSLLYCIETWDPEHTGALVEPHHNTYDIEFWGADGMCTSFYLGALSAAVAMGEACSEPVELFRELRDRARGRLEGDLWNGDYFIQRVQWKDLRAGDPTLSESWTVNYTPEAKELLRIEGPKYQYGNGCLSDGILGEWIACCCGVETSLDTELVRGHLAAVFAYNFKTDLSAHSNPQRPGFALGAEAGLLLCSWPHGNKPTLPFVYSDEVWTGIEYQVASHLIMLGLVEQGLAIVSAVRARYDGRVRNPFNEYECGHWYARAMASYGLLQACSGARYDAVDEVLYLDLPCTGDFRAFLATATGYGTVGIHNGEPFIDVASGSIPARRIEVRVRNAQDAPEAACRSIEP